LKPAVRRWARHSCLAPMAARNVGPTKTPAAEGAGFDISAARFHIINNIRWPDLKVRPYETRPCGPAPRFGPTRFGCRREKPPLPRRPFSCGRYAGALAVLFLFPLLVIERDVDQERDADEQRDEAPQALDPSRHRAQRDDHA
jgi:hypothetical protein